MAKWSVALFGHYKPHDIGWEKRAQPGDIIAFKPFKDVNTWTPTEHKEFLIVTIDGPTKDQMNALCEPYWDTNTWKYYDPKTLVAPIKLPNPKEIIKKRRFNIPLNTLKELGVDELKMLDRELEYNPTLRDILKTESYDKLQDHFVLESDELRLIQPLIIGITLKE